MHSLPHFSLSLSLSLFSSPNSLIKCKFIIKKKRAQEWRCDGVKIWLAFFGTRVQYSILYDDGGDVSSSLKKHIASNGMKCIAASFWRVCTTILFIVIIHLPHNGPSVKRIPKFLPFLSREFFPFPPFFYEHSPPPPPPSKKRTPIWNVLHSTRTHYKSLKSDDRVASLNAN